MPRRQPTSSPCCQLQFAGSVAKNHPAFAAHMRTLNGDGAHIFETWPNARTGGRQFEIQRIGGQTTTSHTASHLKSVENCVQVFVVSNATSLFGLKSKHDYLVIMWVCAGCACASRRIFDRFSHSHQPWQIYFEPAHFCHMHTLTSWK